MFRVLERSGYSRKKKGHSCVSWEKKGSIDASLHILFFTQLRSAEENKVRFDARENDFIFDAVYYTFRRSFFTFSFSKVYCEDDETNPSSESCLHDANESGC